MRNQAVLVLIPAAAIVAALAAPASAGTLKVGKGKQFETIGDAVAMAAEGDKIVVSKGVYTENVNFKDLDGITLIGKRAVWDGGPRDGEPCLSGDGDDWTIQGFTFRNGSHAVDVDGNGWTVRKCTFRSSGRHSFRIDGHMALVEKCKFRGTYESAIDIDGDDATVQRNDIRHIGGRDGRAAVAVRGNRALVERNNLRNVGFHGIWLRTPPMVVPKAGDNGKVLNNRVDNCGESGVLVGEFDDEGSDQMLIEELDDVLVAGNRITAVDGDAITLGGDDCTIERNVVRLGNEQGIDAIGDRVIIRFNTVSDFVDDSAIRVKGDGGEVSDNRTANHDEEGIRYNGDACKILRNRIQDAFDDDGIRVLNEERGDEIAEGGLIEDNLVMDVTDDGIDANLNNGTVRNNTMRSIGVACNDHGIQLRGDGNTVENNLMDDVAGTGVQVEGNGNTINDNVAKNCGRDGFTVRDDNNTLMRCTALNCDGEGIDNQGMGTTVMDCLFKGNRRDVATEQPFANDATFDDDNTFTTGGRDTKPVIGCDD